MSLGFVRQFPHDLSRLLDPLHAVHRFAGPERHRVELPRRGLVGDERGARLYGNADPRSPPAPLPRRPRRRGGGASARSGGRPWWGLFPSAWAAMVLSPYRGWFPASPAATTRVPTRTAGAPAARAAAMARPVPIPPAATPGTLTDGRTSPTIARRPIFPRTWPPASSPFATIRPPPARHPATGSGTRRVCHA